MASPHLHRDISWTAHSYSESHMHAQIIWATRSVINYKCLTVWESSYLHNTSKAYINTLDVVSVNYFQTMVLPLLLFCLQEIAPYNGFGSLEDSLQSCLSLVPQPPKKDFIKMLENDGKVLRFEAVLVCTNILYSYDTVGSIRAILFSKAHQAGRGPELFFFFIFN